MKTALWQHQQDALAFASTRQGTLIAHEMGAGKTATALAICEKEKARRILVMCPLSVVGVWPGQVERHCSESYTVVRLDKGSVAKKGEDARYFLYVRSPARLIIVVNHESAWREPFRSLALKAAWDVVIVDEAHRAKQPGGKFSMFLGQMAKRPGVRIALTGTPMPHSPLDIYGVARFVDPTVFGTSNSLFRARYALMGGYQNHEVVGYQNMDEFERKLATIMHRVRSEDVLDLPPEVDVTRLCQLEPAAMKVYKQMKNQLVAGVEEGLITASNALVSLLRMQQITGGFAKTDEGIEVCVSEAKAKLLAEVLEDLGGKPTVVFCRFKNDLLTVRNAAQTQGLRYAEVSGRIKDGIYGGNDFVGVGGMMREDVDVLGVQIASGGVGIDLSRASTAIYYSLGFSLAELLQARARLHRPGQQNTTTHIHLCAEGTIDEAILRALEARKDLVEGVLEECRKRQEGR